MKDNAEVEIPIKIYCKGPVQIRKSKWTWSNRFAVLENQKMLVYHVKGQEPHGLPCKVWTISAGRMWTDKNNGIILQVRELDTEIHAVVENRTQLLNWINAFHSLSGLEFPDSPLQSNEVESPSNKKKVSFHRSVRVRKFAPLTKKQQQDLFYSREDVLRFSVEACSVVRRTSEAIHCFSSGLLPARFSRKLRWTPEGNETQPAAISTVDRKE